jgi:hypothetical protein
VDTSTRVLLKSKERMKKRGLDSPDHGDALALTLAQTAAAPRNPRAAATSQTSVGVELTNRDSRNTDHSRTFRNLINANDNASN